MVAKVISGKNLRGLILYNETKVSQGVAKCITATGFGADAGKLSTAQKLSRFSKLTSLNKNVRTNAVHISLNFAPGENLSNTKLIEISSHYMKRIGFGGQPYLVYQHHDAGHPHIHIVSTNIKADGSRINLHNIGRNQSEQARKEIEVWFDLVKAGGIGSDVISKIEAPSVEKIEPIIYGKSETKRSVERIVGAVARTYRYTSLAEFNAALRHYNVLADQGAEGSRMWKAGGLLYSILDDNGNKKGTPVKASSLRGKPTLAVLEKHFTLNKALRGRWKDDLRSDIDKVADEALDTDRFVRGLASRQINVIFRYSKDGKIFGVTFVDHNRRIVFNGSDLGKPYSAAALLKKLDSENQQNLEATRRNPFDQGEQRQGEQWTENSHHPSEALQGLLEARAYGANSPDMSLHRRKKRKKKGKSI